MSAERAPARTPPQAAREPSLVLPIIALMVLLLPLPGWLAASFVSPRREFADRPADTREYAFVRRHLTTDFHGYSTLHVLAPQFAMVALSHMAAGLMNVYVAQPERRDELLPLAAEITRRGRSAAVSPVHHDVGPNANIDDHNLYWSHLGLALGVERFIRCGHAACADTDDDRLNTRIVATLRSRLLASALAQAPSYPGSATWPADNTVTLLALRLYDETHATHLADAPVHNFLHVMDAHRDRRTGLYYSSVSPLWYHAIPRGCAISWSTLYLAQVAPDAAYDQYVRERSFLSGDVLGVGGFREWPEGRGGRMDGDSGPIVFGVGMAATGLGLGAARLFGDAERYTMIRRTALLFGVPSWLPSHGYVFAPLLGEAMLFNGRTARPWFVTLRNVPGAPRFPWVPLTFALIDIALLVRVARRLANAIATRRAKHDKR